MAHLRCDFRSEALDMNTSMTVVLPEGVELSTVRVVYLFHGLCDNCSGWSRYTSVERYARKYNVALVIPEVQRSFYTDMAFGLGYFEFIHDELPRLCHGFFNLPLDREHSYVVGLSMGGYAALKCTFNTPERYAGCATFSAVTDIKQRVAASEGRARLEYEAIFGKELTVPENCDILAMAEKADVSLLPRFYTAVGEQDELYSQNERFAALMQDKGADLRWEHWEGIHNWDFWDVAVCRAFDHLFAPAE